jgi:hypothetical protein
MQTGKWYFVVGVYDSANTKLKVWVNGIKKEATASGSASDTNGPFRIGQIVLDFIGTVLFKMPEYFQWLSLTTK